MVKTPICGSVLVSLKNAILVPNSISVSPNCRGPSDGAITPAGRITWICTREMSPQLNSRAGPVESISTGVPSIEPNM